MSSDGSKYEEHIQQLGLKEEQGKELIGALQCIVESLLNKKFMLDGANDSTSSS